MFLVLKYCLAVYFGGKGTQSLIYQATAEGFFLFRRQFRITQRVWYCHCGDNAIGAHSKRNWHDSAHVHYRQTCTFDFLDHRCTATSAGASRGGQDDGIDAIIL